MENLLDKELIMRFVNGDSEAFNILVKKWQTPIYHLAYRYFRNEQDAKDVCQNTFIRVYKNIAKIKNMDSFPIWIHRIAVNLCKDELSKRKKKRLFDFGKNNGENESNSIDNIKVEFEDEVMKNDLCNIIKKAVGSLPEEQRSVLILKEYQGFKFTEVAEILNIPINTAKSRMYYALKNIKNILKKLKLDKEVYKG